MKKVMPTTTIIMTMMPAPAIRAIIQKEGPSDSASGSSAGVRGCVAGAGDALGVVLGCAAGCLGIVPSSPQSSYVPGTVLFVLFAALLPPPANGLSGSPPP